MKKTTKNTPPAPVSTPANAVAATVSQTTAADSGVTLTDDQMQQLAKSFHDISGAVGKIRLDAIKGGAALTDSKIVQLQGLVFALKNISNSFAQQSAKLTLQSADESLKQISTATDAADQALVKLGDIDKAIQIASTVIVLAEAIESRDVSQIAAAAKSVVSASGISVG
jgi:hypothetical protein